MTDSERKEVWSILNAISNFTAGINDRMGSVVCPEEQREMKDKIQEALEKHEFLWNKRGKRRWVMKLKLVYLL